MAEPGPPHNLQRAQKERRHVIVVRRVAFFLSAALAVLAPVIATAQSTPTAALTQWDLFNGTGGASTSIQNIATILRDAAGTAGPQGAVWVAGRRPEPRLARLNPATNEYVEWRPFAGSSTAGAPLGLAVNSTNGDFWVAMQGNPSFMVKLGFTNTFRRFSTVQPLTPQGIVVAADHSAYAAIPTTNSYGQGRAIVRLPRDLTSSTVSATTWRFDQAPAGEPRYLAIDSAGNIWFSDAANNVVGRLNPNTDVSTEWLLPIGVIPVGLHFNGSTACVVSDGLVENAGTVQCVDPATNDIRQFAPTAPGLDKPQQIARNSFGELFVTEWNGNNVVFIGTAAYAQSAITRVTPTTRTRMRSSISFSAQTLEVTPLETTIAHVETTLIGSPAATGQTRYSLPLQAVTYPYPQTAEPQPFGITAAFNDVERGSGTAYIAEYFNGPRGTYAAARISKIEVIASRVIQTSPSTLQFDGTLGLDGTLQQTVSITEPNALAVDWTATSPVSWITLSPSSGTAPGTLTVSVDVSSLTAGTHEAIVTIDDGPGRADPKNILVSINVAPRPVLTVSTVGLAFASRTDTTPPAQTFQITNTGGGILNWTAASSAPWLHIQSAGTAPSTMTVTVDPQAAQGTLTGTITLTSVGAVNSPTTVTVTFVANNGPAAIAVSPPGPLSFAALTGGSSQPQSLTISNSGGDPLTWSATAPAWLTLSPSSGTVPAGGSVTVAVTANGTGLPEGPSSGTIQFASNAATSPSVAATVTVSGADTVAPVITVPSPITLPATGASGAVATFTASALDAIDGTVAVTCVPASGSTFPLGTTTVTCTAKDAANNTATGTFTVTVEDKTAPVLSLPANIVKEAVNAAGATATFTVTATDVFDTSVALTCSATSGANFPITTTTVSCEAVDDAGNKATGAFTILVRDTTAPLVTKPADIVRQAVNASGIAVTFATPPATDAVGVTSVTCLPASGSVFPIGQTTVVCSARDAANNVGTTNFTVTVTDPPPMFSTSSGSLIFQTGRLAYCNGIPVGPNWKDQGFIVTNTGTVPLTYTTSTATTWLRVTPATGTLAVGGSITLVVSVDLTKVSKGTWTGSFSIAAAGGSTQNVPVTLNVGNAPPTLCLTPTFINWGTLKINAKSGSKTFDILNVGDDPLGAWTITNTATQGVVTTTVVSGTGPKSKIGATVKTTAIKGTQSGTITVTAPGAVQGTQVINLSWLVQ